MALAVALVDSGDLVVGVGLVGGLSLVITDGAGVVAPALVLVRPLTLAGQALAVSLSVASWAAEQRGAGILGVL